MRGRDGSLPGGYGELLELHRAVVEGEVLRVILPLRVHQPTFAEQTKVSFGQSLNVGKSQLTSWIALRTRTPRKPGKLLELDQLQLQSHIKTSQEISSRPSNFK